MTREQQNLETEEVVVVNGAANGSVNGNGNGVHLEAEEGASLADGFAEKLACYADKISLGAHQAKKSLGALGERLATKTAEAKDGLKHVSEQAFDNAKYASGEVGVQARAHPLLLVGIAVVAGALIARIGQR